MPQQRATARRRIKISATVDPLLIQAVDAYAAQTGLDRSAVIDEALTLWYARQQEAAMEAQYVGGEDERPPAEEWSAWRAIQHASAERLFGSQEKE